MRLALVDVERDECGACAVAGRDGEGRRAVGCLGGDGIVAVGRRRGEAGAGVFLIIGIGGRSGQEVEVGDVPSADVTPDAFLVMSLSVTLLSVIGCEVALVSLSVSFATMRIT